eukprot:1344986-Pyramimonas_sp.AAC.1
MADNGLHVRSSLHLPQPGIPAAEQRGEAEQTPAFPPRASASLTGQCLGVPAYPRTYCAGRGSCPVGR